MNSYQSFYLIDLERKIRELALDGMLAPDYGNNGNKEDSLAVRDRNEKVAIYNDGIRHFACELIEFLRKATEEEDADA